MASKTEPNATSNGVEIELSFEIPAGFYYVYPNYQGSEQIEGTDLFVQHWDEEEERHYVVQEKLIPVGQRPAQWNEEIKSTKAVYVAHCSDLSAGPERQTLACNQHTASKLEYFGHWS